MYFKYSLNRREKKQGSGLPPIISDEWFEPIDDEDERYRKIWKRPRNWRGAKKRAGWMRPPSPPMVIEDVNEKKGYQVYYINCTHDKHSLVLKNVWARP